MIGHEIYLIHIGLTNFYFSYIFFRKSYPTNLLTINLSTFLNSLNLFLTFSKNAFVSNTTFPLHHQYFLALDILFILNPLQSPLCYTTITPTLTTNEYHP
jgi:hypothetical protein